MKSVRLQRLAEAEFLRSVRYYEAEQNELGERFLQAFIEVRDRIAEAPDQGQRAGFKDYRSVQMHTFPFRLVYEERSDAIWVYAVAHASRRPGYWKRRRIEN